MQTIYLDISNKGVIPIIYAKQGDVGRKFEVILTDSGLPYIPAIGSVFSVWYSGASGEGNYTDIGDKSAFSVSGNKVIVEMISQMLSNSGDGTLCLVLNDANGNQIGTWNIRYLCESIPGSESEEAKSYYTAFSEAVQNLPYPDPTLSLVGKSADAAAVGAALAGKAPAGYGLGGDAVVMPDFNTTAACGFYYYFSTSGNRPSLIASSGVAVVYQKSGTGIVQEVTDYEGKRAIRYSTSGEWEYLNPAMALGVEYRTTERYNGKPVYAIAIDVGAAPASGWNSVNLNIYNVETVIEAKAHSSNGYTLPSISGNSTTYDFYGRVSAYPNGDLRRIVVVVESNGITSNTVITHLRYTKTTD